METNTNEYRISFFKPVTKATRANRNMVIWLILIWAVAVFGFQVALKILEKPTPEPVLVSYNAVKANVYSGNASNDEIKAYATAPLQVLCKVFVSPEDRIILQDALNWAIFDIADGEQVANLKEEIANFENIEAATTDITDAVYQEAKHQLTSVAAPILGISNNDIRAKILPLELSSEYKTTLSDDEIASLEKVLNKYLIHNESVLTNTIVLGFPLHYLYTAVFLLVLFIGLCLLYCIRIDALNKKYQIED